MLIKFQKEKNNKKKIEKDKKEKKGKKGKLELFQKEKWNKKKKDVWCQTMHVGAELHTDNGTNQFLAKTFF